MFAINLTFIKLPLATLLIVFLASCSCSSNAPLRDLVVPTVTSTTPSTNSKNAVINTFINVTFSEKMNESSINTNTFQLFDNTGSLVNGSIVYSGTNATFKPDQILTKTAVYSVKISRQVKDVAGNQIVSDYLWDFTTGILQDESSPMVDSVIPEPYTIDIPVNTNIVINLTEIASSSSVDATSFLVTDIDANVVTGVFTVEGKTITFNPDLDLDSDTKYVVTLNTDIQDLSGNGLAAEYITQFTTIKLVDTTPPLVNSISPASNDVDIARNVNVIISFSEDINTDSASSTSLLIVDSNNQEISGIIETSGANVIFDPTTNFTNNMKYTVTVTTDIEDLFGNKLETPFVWSFTTGSSDDILGPTVSYINPENNAIDISNNNAITVTFSEEINPTTLFTFGVPNISVTKNGSLVSANISYSGNTIIFRPTSLLTDNSLYTVSLNTNITDLAGNKMLEDYTWKFTTGTTIDRDIPTVTSVYPENLSANIAVNTAIVARFSEPMDPSSINADSVTVVDDSGIAVEGSLIVGVMKTIGASVTFRPLNPLAFSTNYTVTINTQAADLATNALEADYVWTFSTSTEEDTIKPTIISTVPSSSSSFAPINRGLIVTFNETMDLESINSATFFMTDINANIIPGNIYYAGDIVTFIPNNNLTFSKTYIATVTSDVADISGNTLGLAHSWSFTTSAEIDTTPPQIISTLPSNGSLAVSNTSITINFDKNMDTTSFTSATIQLFTATNQLVPGTISGTSQSAIFTPIQDLEFDTDYSVTVNTGVRDLSKIHLSTNYSWVFKTSLPASVAPPFVVSTTPITDQEKVKVDSSLNVTFSEAINCPTAAVSNFTLTQNLNPVTGSVSCNGLIVTFTPTNVLLTDSTFTATLGTSILDMHGDGLVTSYSWQFSTAPWTQQFGSVSSDEGTAIAIDNTDNVYTAGNTGGNLVSLSNGLTDIFVSKHSKNSELIWSKQFGSGNVDTITDIALDSTGNTYVSGYSYGDFSGSNNGSADIIVLKLDSDGNEVWKKQLGTVQDDIATAIQVDSNGDLILTGYSSTGFDGNASSGLHDVIVFKLSSTGTLVWSQQFGSGSKDIANDLVLDGSDNIYVTGYSEGDIDGSASAGSTDIFISQLNSSGTLQWTKKIGTSVIDEATSIAIDSNDDLYISGFTKGALDGKTALGSTDQFVLKYDVAGTLLWSILLGTDKDDIANGITIDNNDDIIVTGYTLGDLDGTNLGSFDLTLIKLDSTSTEQWSKQYGTTQSDLGFALSHDSNNNIYFTGRSQGELDAIQNAGSDDVIIMKWDELGTKQ